MFATLHLKIDVDDFFRQFDKNLDDKLESAEIKRMLESAEFQRSEVAPVLLRQYLEQSGHGVVVGQLLTGITRDFTVTNRKMIDVKDRLVIN